MDLDSFEVTFTELGLRKHLPSVLVFVSKEIDQRVSVFPIADYRAITQEPFTIIVNKSCVQSIRDTFNLSLNRANPLVVAKKRRSIQTDKLIPLIKNNHRVIAHGIKASTNFFVNEDLI